MSSHNNTDVLVDSDKDSEGDAIMSELNDHHQEKNLIINDQILDDVTNSTNNNLANDHHHDTNNIDNLLQASEGGSNSSNSNNQEIEVYDDWSKEEHIQFLQAFKRYGTDWEKVMQCLPSRNDVDQVKAHGIKYLQNGKLGTAYYDYLKKEETIQDGVMNDSLSEDEEENEEDAISKISPYLSTPEALASAFFTNRESVREWNLETRRFETNVEKLKNKEPLDCSPTSTNSIYNDKLSLIQSNYGELLETLDIEKQTQMMDEEVKLMRQDNKMKSLTPFERVVARESKEKIEELIGKKIQDQPIIEPPTSEVNPPQLLNDGNNSTQPIGTNQLPTLPLSSTNPAPSTITLNSTPPISNNTPLNTVNPVNPELLSNQPNYRNIYTFLGALFEPSRYDTEELGAMLSLQEKEILQILLHNLSITLSTQQFQEEYSTYVQQISSSQIRQQQAAASNPLVNNVAPSSINSVTSGIENPFAGQPQQVSMLQLLSGEDTQTPPPFTNNNFNPSNNN